jgi:methionyl aminopeptidase
MIIGKSRKELDKMRAAGRLIGQVREYLRSMVKPGITTLEIDREAERMIRDAGALPTFKGYNGFPYSICASVNEQIVHGFPSDYERSKVLWATQRRRFRSVGSTRKS